jgi:hypothetical protein
MEQAFAGVPIMSRCRESVDQPEHYRRKAQEALEAAELARGDLRTAWSDMARAWFELADFYEKSTVPCSVHDAVPLGRGEVAAHPHLGQVVQVPQNKLLPPSSPCRSTAEAADSRLASHADTGRKSDACPGHRDRQNPRRSLNWG